jgi:Ca2+-binding EF-hand superfamily protein
MKGPAAQPSHKRETDNEKKMRERREELEKEEAKKAKDKLESEINSKVKKAVTTYRKALYQIKEVIKRKGTDMRAVFRIYDENKDFQVDFDELQNILKDQKIPYRESDLKRVFKLIDQQGKGKVAHITFAKIMDDPESLNIERYVRSLLDIQGNWVNEESKQNAEEDLTDKPKSYETTVGEGNRTQQDRKDIGSVSGLSDIMKRSAATDDPKAKFFDDNDTLQVYSDVKDMLKVKLMSFADVL